MQWLSSSSSAPSCSVLQFESDDSTMSQTPDYRNWSQRGPPLVVTQPRHQQQGLQTIVPSRPPGRENQGELHLSEMTMYPTDMEPCTVITQRPQQLQQPQRVERRQGEGQEDFFRRLLHPFRRPGHSAEFRAVEYVPSYDSAATGRTSQINIIGQQNQQNVQMQIERGKSESRPIVGALVTHNTADGVGTNQRCEAEGPGAEVSYLKASNGAHQTGKAKSCVVM